MQVVKIKDLISPAASNMAKMSYRKQWYFQMVDGLPDITRVTSCVLCMYICMYVCMYVCVRVCLCDLCLYVWIYAPPKFQ